MCGFTSLVGTLLVFNAMHRGEDEKVPVGIPLPGIPGFCRDTRKGKWIELSYSLFYAIFIAFTQKRKLIMDLIFMYNSAIIKSTLGIFVY